MVGFAVFRAKGSSDTRVAQGVEHALEQLRRQHADVDIQLVSSSVAYTLASYDAAIMTLVEGAALTVLVVFLFLRSWRATLVAAIALPLSILPAFAVMAWFGYTLNSITLLALTLVIGILVDDAIVEIENIERHLDMGKRPYRAALDASDAIGFAVVAITATIVAVFLPVSFIGGFVGQYFAPFGVTVSAAVLASLLVARLVTRSWRRTCSRQAAGRPAPGSRPCHRPARALPAHAGLGAAASPQEPGAGRRLPGRVAGAGAAAAVGLHARQRSQPEPGRRVLSAGHATVPDGRQARRDGGAAAPAAKCAPSSPRRAARTRPARPTSPTQVLIRLVPADQRELSQKAFEHAVRPLLDAFPDTRYAFRGDSAARDVSIILAGADADALSRAAHALERDMRALPGLANVQVKEPLPRPELLIRPRADEAARAGVTTASIGTVARIATVGDTNANSARFNFADRQVPVRVLLPALEQGDLQALGNLRVSTDSGATVALRSVADIGYGSGPARIERSARLRRISVDADLSGTTLGTALEAIDALPALRELPAGVRRIEYGDAEYMREMFEKFSVAMTFGVLMVYAVLILLFRDFLQPLTILTSLPLAIGGAVGGLLLYGAAIDLPVVIGLLMLMGIVTKNSILMVEFVIEKRRHGMARHEALMQSGAERADPSS